MSVMPSPAHKQKIVREFFQKRAIELQTAVIELRERESGVGEKSRGLVSGRILLPAVNRDIGAGTLKMNR